MVSRCDKPLRKVDLRGSKRTCQEFRCLTPDGIAAANRTNHRATATSINIANLERHRHPLEVAQSRAGETVRLLLRQIRAAAMLSNE